MYLFEGADNPSDFENGPNESGPGRVKSAEVPKQLLLGWFTAITTFTTQNAEGFTPCTLPGRVYQVRSSG